MRSFYEDTIAAILEVMGRTDVDPSAVEEVMRDRFRTLDGLYPAEFNREARKAVKVLDAIGGV